MLLTAQVVRGSSGFGFILLAVHPAEKLIPQAGEYVPDLFDAQ